ncbi:MAG: hypothetical protein QOE63_1019 [Acidimicrobiaceae bacterium]
MLGSNDPGAVKQAAKDILAGKDFNHSKSLFDRITEWLSDHLSFQLSSGSGPGVVGYVIWLVIIGFVIYLVVRLIASWERRRRPASVDDSPIVELERRQTAAEWDAGASLLERDGKHREALRARYRELVARLIDDGTIVEQVGRTSGELRLEVIDARPAAAVAFGDATDKFEATWYGHRPSSAADVSEVRRLATVVLASARERAPVTTS